MKERLAQEFNAGGAAEGGGGAWRVGVCGLCQCVCMCMWACGGMGAGLVCCTMGCLNLDAGTLCCPKSRRSVREHPYYGWCPLQLPLMPHHTPAAPLHANTVGATTPRRVGG